MSKREEKRLKEAVKNAKREQKALAKDAKRKAQEAKFATRRHEEAIEEIWVEGTGTGHTPQTTFWGNVKGKLGEGILVWLVLYYVIFMVLGFLYFLEFIGVKRLVDPTVFFLPFLVFLLLPPVVLVIIFSFFYESLSKYETTIIKGYVYLGEDVKHVSSGIDGAQINVVRVNGKALGMNIVIRTKTVTTATSHLDGNYSLSIGSRKDFLDTVTLKVSKAGYKPQTKEVQVAGSQVIGGENVYLRHTKRQE